MSRRERGFTVVELMMALAILAIGVTGIIAMQRATIVSNQHAKNLLIASHIAQAWQDQLTAEATRWNRPSPVNSISDLGADTVWLAQVNPSAGAWFRPAHNARQGFGPIFDALGNPLPANQIAQARFCTHIRLSWLYPDNQGNGLIRTEVRVFWARQGASVTGTFCDAVGNAAVIGTDVQTYHFVYKASAVRQHTTI